MRGIRILWKKLNALAMTERFVTHRAAVKTLRLVCVLFTVTGLSAAPFNGYPRKRVEVKRTQSLKSNREPASAAPELCHCITMVTPPTAADTSAPTFGPLSCRMTPFAFCS